jgi:N utilization substance protein B
VTGLRAVRHQAREAALQVLYFCELSDAVPADALDAFFAEHQPQASEDMRAFTTRLVHGTMGSAAELDPLVDRHVANWRPERVALIDRLILRLGAWELRQADAEAPPAVVIDEAVELARTFGSDESTRFVNGVLDAVRRTLEAGR